jgi:hypothetical protein
MSVVRVIGFLLTAILFACVAWLAVLGWRQLDEPTGGRNADVERIDVEASLQPNGVVAVRTTHHFRHPVDRFHVFIPDGVDRVMVNGTMIDNAFVSVDVPVESNTVEVAWDVQDATKRWSDAAVVSWPLTRSLISVVDDTSPVDIRAVLYLPNGAALDVASDLSDGRRALDAPGARLSGRSSPWSDTEAVVRVDPATVPEVPLGDGRSGGAAFRSEAERLDASTIGIVDASHIVELVATVLLTAFGVLFLGTYLFGLTRRLARRGMAKARGMAERTDPPAGLRPTIVGLATGGAGRGERSLVAATILELTMAELVSIDGITSEEFVLKVNDGSKPSIPAQRIVLDALKAEGGGPTGFAPAELRGPPLWRHRRPTWVRGYRRAVISEARGAGLISYVFSGAGLFIMTIVCGTLGAIATASPLGVLLATVGPWIALIAVACNGVSLTKKGLQVRSEGEAYARHLRQNTQLTEVGAPGVVIWGEALAYAAALGAAPKAAEALSPRLSSHG